MLKKYKPTCETSENSKPVEVQNKPHTAESAKPVEVQNKSHTAESAKPAEVQNKPHAADSMKSVPAIATSIGKKTKTSAIENFFSAAGIKILEKGVSEFDSIIYLVNAIAGDFKSAEDFLHTLRKAICTHNGHFDYSLNTVEAEKRSAVTRLATIMRNCGVFSEVVIGASAISGNISTASRVRNFISGIWLELYSQHKTISIVKKFAEKHNLPFEVYCNLKVEGADGKKHEIDLMFSLGEDKVFGAEIKSGLNFCDYDRYRLTAEWMQLIPDRFLLLNSTLTDENAVKCISYFYQYFICGISTYEETLIKMLDKAMKAD